MSESESPTRENSITSTLGSRRGHVHLARGQDAEHVLSQPAFQSFTQGSIAQRINSALGSFRDRRRAQQADVLSGLSGLRVGSKGQMEVDRSIWDLTKGVHVEEQKVGSVTAWWEALSEDAKTVVRTVRCYPLVAIIPLALLLLMLGGGLWAVFASAAKERSHRREVAQQLVSDKALYLETELAKAFLPAYVTSVYVRRDPAWPAVNASFAPMAMEMIRLSNAGSVLTLSLIPNGVIYTMVPLAGSSPADDPNWRAIGKDWLQDRFNQDKVLQAVSTRNLTIIGPYNLTQGGIGLVAMLSINVAGAAPSASFDVPPYVHGSLGTWQAPPRTQAGPNLTNTPFGPYMYDAATSTKWWGLTTVLISWDVLRENVTRLDDLERQGYEYVLARPVLRKELLQARPDLADGSHELAVAWSDAVQPVPANATNNRAPPRRPGAARPLVYYDLHEHLNEPVSSVIRVEGAQLTLYASLRSGWTPDWEVPLAAAVAVISCLLAAMLFLVLANRRQHMRLLHAMIPKKVISTLRRGKVFTESFEVVTMLFADIVAYTTMSASMAPIEVVQMLDELYVEFDDLAEKHKLYKLDTIGDAFMLVGGAPDSEGAAAAAARVAQMGLDMIRTTSTKVLAGGHVVKIRVGVHSGPAVAAVVGRKAPKYTLFGDTVNTASRMESNGSPMRIHVSAATAELLQQAGGFAVEPRGEIPIKGKGLMSTFWVTGTAVWPHGPCPRSEAIDISLLAVPAAASAPPAQGKIPENRDAERAATAQTAKAAAAALEANGGGGVASGGGDGTAGGSGGALPRILSSPAVSQLKSSALVETAPGGLQMAAGEAAAAKWRPGSPGLMQSLLPYLGSEPGPQSSGAAPASAAPPASGAVSACAATLPASCGGATTATVAVAMGQSGVAAVGTPGAGAPVGGPGKSPRLKGSASAAALPPP